MPKRAFIIHGWGGTPDEHWLPWLKNQLEDNGFEATTPAMPNTDEPVISEWVAHLAKIVGQPDPQTYFIGHSVGCQTILRYLETIPDQSVAGCVFVAGWLKLEGEIYEEGDEIMRLSQPWLQTPIQFDQVQETTNKFSVFLSDNDPYNAVEENARLFREKLNARVDILHDQGHFTADDGVTELPQVFAAIQAISP